MNTNVNLNTTIHNDWRRDCLGSVVLVDERQKRPQEPTKPGRGHEHQNTMQTTTDKSTGTCGNQIKI